MQESEVAASLDHKDTREKEISQMPEKSAWVGLSTIQAFPSYQDQAAAAAAGAPGAKNYLAAKDRKPWFDPTPESTGATPENPKGFKDHFEMGGVQFVRYLFAFKGKRAADESGGVENLVMTLTEAATVNIAPTGPGMTNVPGTGKDVPTPFKQNLLPTQKLLRQTPLSGFDIRNLDVILPTEQAAADAQSTTAAVARIEAKIDRIMVALKVA